ncbi:MAG: phosphatidylserine decarboxylase [Clostridia bacterium]|nr:phosphatidylserine decarboxylase [Clostridia bacterium]MBO7289750.1 phosphatidylserine decarboxylase [Clostridia bacterium]
MSKLYTTFAGRMLLKILTAPAVSKMAGSFMESFLSKFIIEPFIKKNKIDMSDYKIENWKCFNHFFTRNLRPGKRPIDMNPVSLISPCDGYLTVYNISDDSSFEIKNSVYTLDELLMDSNLASEYHGGLCLVFRLTPSDYHRYIYPDTGAKLKNTYIPGIFHTVRPVAFKKYPVFKTNSREYTVLGTNNFDDVVFMEVGAMMVGKIVNYHQEYNFTKGEEKGRFEFGGSTIIMLIKKDVALIDTEIKSASNRGEEYKVKLGESIGVRI